MIAINRLLHQITIPHSSFLIPHSFLLLGLGVRVVGLTRQSFWTDELYVLGEARQPLDVLFNPLLHLQHPPGYRLLVHGWLGLDTGEGWLRLLPVLAGTGLILAVWALARALWPDRPRAAGCAALLAATSPFLLHYSRDMTAYSWTALWVTLSMGLLVRAWQTDRAALWAAWAVSAAVAMYSHYFSLFPLLATSVAVGAAGLAGGRAARGRLAHAAVAGAGAGALYLPWLAVLGTRQGDVLGSFMFPLSVDSQPLGWLAVLLAGYAHPAFWLSRAGTLLAWLVVISAGAWGAWRLWRARARSAAGGVALLAGWGLAALAGPYLFLRLTTPPEAVDPVRFAALAAPALVLGLGAALAALPAPARLGALGAWLVLAGLQWSAELTSPPTQDWRGLLGVVAAQARPDDIFLAFPAFHTGAAATYYPVPLPVQGGWFVGEGADPAGAAYWFPPGWTWQGFLHVHAERSTDWAGEIGARVSGASRVWYLAGDGVDGTYKPSPAAARALAGAGYIAAQEWRASPLVLRLYLKAPP